MADFEPYGGSPSQEVTFTALHPRLRSFLPADLMARLDEEMRLTDGTAPPAEVLRDVLQAISELKHNLNTYLPRSLTHSRPKPGVPCSEWLEGTVLFVDVTGFTPLAERLSALGEEGAERLNRMTNDLFAAMLDVLSRSGGDLLIFAGDALQAFFPASENAQDTIRAVGAGLHMIRAIEPFGQGSMPMSASVGLARGRFLAAQIGIAERMEYLVTGGPIQEAMQAEEKAAPRQVILAPGLETLLTERFLLTHIGDGYYAVVDNLNDELRPLESSGQPTGHQGDPSDPSSVKPSLLIPHIALVLSEIEATAPFFPPNVFRRIVAHQRERQFPGEHRLVAVMFVNLRGFETLVQTLGTEALDQLTYWADRYFVEAHETLVGSGGLVTQLDPYREGFTLLCPFGAPLADEDMPHRAAAAALRLNEKLELLNRDLQTYLHERLAPDRLNAAGLGDMGTTLRLVHHIGITYGPIYTGQVGWQERREYVVAGDDVNLSARLMNKSEPGQILISGWVYDRVRQAFECQPLEPMTLKGKAKPVTVYAVEKRVPTSAWLREAAVGPWVGRGKELASLENALESLEAGRGGILTVVGETGIGKTRLIAELALRARYWDIELLAGRCLSYAQNNPYTPWIEGLWRWFELDTAVDSSEQRARVDQELERIGVGHLTQTVEEVLGLPQSGEIVPQRSMPPRPRNRLDLFAMLQERIAQTTTGNRDLHLTLARRLIDRDPTLASDLPSLWEQLGRSTHPDEALLVLFQEIARQEKPVLFVIEDLQWVDHASWNPLVRLGLATAQHPIFVLVTARPGSMEERWQREISQGVRSDRVELEGLDWTDTGKLVTRLIKAREAAPDLVSWLYERARGNPLFTSQLLYALAGADGLSTDPETGRVTLSKELPRLPLTVREIMLSRVDQLSERTRAVVKLASVIGDTVSWELLVHLSHQVSLSGGTQLLDHLKELADQSLLTPAPPAPEFTFVHPLLQEAVYSSVPYAQRRRWHRTIAEYIAQRDAETTQQRLEALAYHYRHSDAPGLGIRYSRLAGDQARARQAWDEAVGYYKAAATITPSDPTFIPERGLAYERLGDAYTLTERYILAAEAYQAALAETADQARVEGKLGLIFPLLDAVEVGSERLAEAWTELGHHAPLRPWLAGALGWLALRARPRDMAAIASSGAAAVAWWQRGQRAATTENAQLALKEMMAGRVPPQFSQLVRLALEDEAREGK